MTAGQSGSLEDGHRRRARRRRFLSLAAAVALLWTVVAAPAASAHATVVSTDPADGTVLQQAPTEISITFDEAVELQLGALRVFAPDNSRADDGSATHLDGKADTATIPLRSDLKNGTYIVSWRVISADSHPVHGAFTFSLGAPSKVSGNSAADTTSSGSKAVGILFGVARWLAYLGFALLVGSAVLMIAFAPGLARDHRARRVMAAGWFGLLLGTLGALLLQGPYGAGFGLGQVFDTGVIHATLKTRLGEALAWRLVLLGAAGLVISWISSRLPEATLNARRLIGGAGAAIAVAMTVTWAAADHSSTGIQVAAAMPADVAHLLAMACWIGGLAVLSVAVLGTRTPSETLSDDEREGVVRRFSTLAFTSVCVLAGTGVYQGWRQVRTLHALTSTDYGRLLLIKAGCFILLIALGSYARRRLAAKTPDLSVLRRSVGAEFGIAVVVLAVTSLLVESQPANTVATAPVSVSAAFDTGSANGKGTVNVILDPARVGSDTLHIYVLGQNGEQESVPEVDAALSLPSQDLGPLPVKLNLAGPGHYIGSDATIPLAGAWQVIITVRTTDIDEATVTVQTPVR